MSMGQTFFSNPNHKNHLKEVSSYQKLQVSRLSIPKDKKEDLF